MCVVWWLFREGQLMSFQQMPRFVFTTEQKQKILYGEYFNGVDAPLKSSLQVKIARSWAREQARRKTASGGRHE
jgi:hypothetical protein